MAQPMQQQRKIHPVLKDQQIKYGSSCVIQPHYKDDDALSLVRWKIMPPKVDEVPKQNGLYEIGRAILLALLFIGVALAMNFGLNGLGLGWLVHG